MGDRLSKLVVIALVVAAICIITYSSSVSLYAIKMSDQLDSQSTQGYLVQLRSNYRFKKLTENLKSIESELTKVKAELASAQHELDRNGQKPPVDTK